MPTWPSGWTIAWARASPPRSARPPAQAHQLQTIATVPKVPESSVAGHINHASLTLASRVLPR